MIENAVVDHRNSRVTSSNVANQGQVEGEISRVAENAVVREDDEAQSSAFDSQIEQASQPFPARPTRRGRRRVFFCFTFPELIAARPSETRAPPRPGTAGRPSAAARIPRVSGAGADLSDSQTSKREYFVVVFFWIFVRSSREMLMFTLSFWVFSFFGLFHSLNTHRAARSYLI